MRVFKAQSSQDFAAWRQYVHGHEASDHYHRLDWKGVIERGFGWPTFFLMAEQDGRVQGVLPLVWQKSRLFGSFLTSLPFLNGGGTLAGCKEADDALLEEAARLARDLRVSHVEFRFRRNPQLALPTKTTKVAVIRSIEPDADRMLRELPHKVRSDVRKALKSGLTAEFAGTEALDDFYRLFAINMRALGTPVYSKAFFREILKAFPDETYISLVRHTGKPIAASFLMGHRGVIEAGWSSSLYQYASLKPNMFLYWKIFCFAGEKGYRTFDFGRSSVGSGTHRFKMQWGSQEVQLYWVYWLPDGAELPELNPQNTRYRAAIWAWQRLPLSFTNWLGPKIVRCLP